ncbi:MAG: ATP-binding protein [Puniceicoccaceae bacterium]
MEASIPGSIEPDTLFHALALNGTSLLVLDQEGIITWASHAAHVLFDCQQDGALQGVQWSELIQIEGRSVWDSALDREYAESGMLKTDGFCDAGSRGRIAMEVVMYPNRSTGERLVVIRDITERKSYELQLEDEKRHAESLNRALQNEISKANELAVMAERSNIAKSVFLTSMSHEFRTPLNGVLGYAQILSGNESLPLDCRRAAETIERCGQHLLSIINDVLDLSKIEAGRVEVIEETLHLPNLVNEVIEVFQARADAKGLVLHVKFGNSSAHLQWILGDGKLIRQVLMNLISNAVKFTDQGMVTLWVEVRANSSATEKQAASRLHLMVEDTGPGIERHHLHQVFEEFYQTEAFSGHKGGTGLGLSISRKLAEAMGGRLTVTSEQGKGSRFLLDLPCRPIDDPKVMQATTEEDVRHLCIRKDRDVGFIRAFRDELDRGVLKSFWESIALSPSSNYGIETSLFEIEPSRHENWFVGASAEELMSDNAKELMKWAGMATGRVTVLLYLDCNEGACETMLKCLQQKDMLVIPVEIPIEFGKLKQALAEACADVFERIGAEESTSSPAVAEQQLPDAVSDEKPDHETLLQMLRAAQMGDMREFDRRLRSWVDDHAQETRFEQRVRRWVTAFQIDELCSYLESLVFSSETLVKEGVERRRNRTPHTGS